MVLVLVMFNAVLMILKTVAAVNVELTSISLQLQKVGFTALMTLQFAEQLDVVMAVDDVVVIVLVRKRCIVVVVVVSSSLLMLVTSAPMGNAYQSQPLSGANRKI
jgi:hypothetical protein